MDAPCNPSAADTTVSVLQSDEMVEALKKQGSDVTYTRLPGVGYNARDYAYNEALLSRLLSKKR